MKYFGLEKPEWKAVYCPFPKKEVLETERFCNMRPLGPEKSFSFSKFMISIFGPT